jgi:hypothetical protein
MENPVTGKRSAGMSAADALRLAGLIDACGARNLKE